MCPNFYMLYYLENTKLTEYKTYKHSHYKPMIGKEGLLLHTKNLDTSQSHLDYRGYSCHQGLLSTWHDTNHMMRWMEWWCTLLIVMHVNTLTVYILSFQQNQGMCVLSYVLTDLIHSGHLMLLIHISWLYSRCTTCH